MDEELPAPWPDVLDALRSITDANSEVFRLVEIIRTRHDAAIDDLHSELWILKNRFEAHVEEQDRFNRIAAGLES